MAKNPWLRRSDASQDPINALVEIPRYQNGISAKTGGILAYK